jgi:hypothetical protein
MERRVSNNLLLIADAGMMAEEAADESGRLGTTDHEEDGGCSMNC